MGAFRGTKAVWIWKDLLFYFGGSFRGKGKGLSATFLFSCVHQRISGICQKRIIEVHSIANFSNGIFFIVKTAQAILFLINCETQIMNI